MELQQVSDYAIKKLVEQGADKAQVYTSQITYDEITYENGHFSLMRSVDDYSIKIVVIKNNKEGSYSINELGCVEIDKAIQEALKIANSGRADECYDIAPPAESKTFSHGPQSIDREGMYQMVDRFVNQARVAYPEIGIRSATVSNFRNRTHMLNTNGTEVVINKSYYIFGTLFNAQEGKNSSSMNFDSFCFNDFDKSVFEQSNLERSFTEATMQLHTEKVTDAFVGAVIISPQCFADFLRMVLPHLDTAKLIAKTSRFQDKIGEVQVFNKIN